MSLHSHRKNLVMVRAGGRSTHMSYCGDPRERNFDVGLSWYDTGSPEEFGLTAGIQFVHDGRAATPIEGQRRMLADCAARFDDYDYVWFADDDVVSDAETISAMFDICHRFALDAAQPAMAIAPDCFNNHPITAVHRPFKIRYTNFIEGIAMVVSTRVLPQIGSTLTGARSAYGLDVVWGQMVRLGTMAIIDETPVTHSRPSDLANFSASAAQAAARNNARYSFVGRQFMLTYGGITTDGEFVSMGGDPLDGSRRVLDLIEQSAPGILESLHQLEPEARRLRLEKYLAGNRDFVASSPAHTHVGSLLREQLELIGVEL